MWNAKDELYRHLDDQKYFLFAILWVCYNHVQLPFLKLFATGMIVIPFICI